MKKAASRHSLALSSGREARNWRKSLSSSAIGKNETPIRSIVYPLDMPFNEESWGKASASYDLTNGITQGSLTWFLMRLHLLGFRLFDSASKRSAWQASELMGDTAFLKAWDEQCLNKGLKYSSIVPSELIVEFLSRPRTTKTKTVTEACDAEIISDRLVRKFGKADDLVQLASDIGLAVATACPTWAAMIDDVALCGKCMDDMFKAHGFTLPSMASAFKKATDAEASRTSRFTKFPMAWDAKMSKWMQVNVVPKHMIHMVVARYIGEYYESGMTGDPSKFVQAKITTLNAGALSSLFNPKTGLGYICETDAPDICSDMGVSGDDAEFAISALKHEASQLLSDDLFDIPLAKNCRTDLGGRLNSWVANYCKRLKELTDGLQDIDDIELPDLSSEPYSSCCYGSVTKVSIIGLMDLLKTMAASVQSSLTRLNGIGECLPSHRDVESIEMLIQSAESLSGVIGMLNNRLEQNKAPKIKLPAWIGNINRLNRFSGGQPDYEAEIEYDVKKFKALIVARRNHLKKIMLTYPIQGLQHSAMKQLVHRERVRTSPDVYARRIIFQRLSSVARNSEEPIMQMIKKWVHEFHLFKRADVNRFFDNNQGLFYKPVYSKQRQRPFNILDVKKFISIDFMQHLEVLVERISKEFPNHIDALKLENVHTCLLLAGLPDTISHSLVKINGDVESYLTIHPALQLRLSEEDVERDAVINLFASGYHSSIEGLLSQIKRTGFKLNAGLSPYDKATILYSPKEGTWCVPEHDRKSVKYADVFESSLCEFEYGNELNSAQSAMNIAKALVKGVFPNDVEAENALALLRQIPHHWMVQTGVKEQGSSQLGFFVSEGKILAPKLHKGCTRIIGPSKLKYVLDDTLTNFTKIGAPRIYFSKQLKQAWNGLSIDLETLGYSVSLHTPVTEPLMDQESDIDVADRPYAMGVDLNKSDIGFTVMQIKDKKIIASVKVKTKRVRKVEDQLGAYRRRVQPNQAYGVKFNTTLSNVKEQAVAEMVSIIDGVSKKYNAIPILEAIGKQKSKGGAHLKSIFEDVTRHYTFSIVDAHKSMRVEHWGGGDRWVDDRFKNPKKSSRKKVLSEKLSKDGLELQPVSIFPGSATSGFRTSTKCSCCGKDPSAAAYDALGKDADKTYKTDHEGYTRINGELVQISLPGKVSSEVYAKHKRLKQNIPFQPYANKSITADKLPGLIRKSLRRPELHLSSRASKAAVYHCLYAECGKVQDSSLNAATNIVDRWITGQSTRTEAFENWDVLPADARKVLIDAISG